MSLEFTYIWQILKLLLPCSSLASQQNRNWSWILCDWTHACNELPQSEIDFTYITVVKYISLKNQMVFIRNLRLAGFEIWSSGILWRKSSLDPKTEFHRDLGIEASRIFEQGKNENQKVFCNFSNTLFPKNKRNTYFYEVLKLSRVTLLDSIYFNILFVIKPRSIAKINPETNFYLES